MMAEPGAKSNCTHRLVPRPAFQADEQGGRVGPRPFRALVVGEDFEDLRGQWQQALLVAFTGHPDLTLRELYVFPLQGQDLTRAQTVEEHQAHQGDIPAGAKAWTYAGSAM